MDFTRLIDYSHRVASALRLSGVKPGCVVGVYGSRSIDSIVAQLGVLRAGAIILNLDPNLPDERLRYLIADTSPTVLITPDETDQSAAETRLGLSSISIASCLERPANAAPHTEPVDAAGDVACIMYTSGSTGAPKGVRLAHQGILRLAAPNDTLQLGPQTVFLHAAPLAFDAHLLEVWCTLASGGAVAILPDPVPSLAQIGDVIAQHNVNTAWLTAGVFHLMIDENLEGLKPLRVLAAGGDVLSPRHVGQLLDAHPHIRLVNGYGPTENSIFTTCHVIERADVSPDATIPIGKAVRGTTLHVLDEHMRPVPDGQLGQLCVTGEGVAQGYHNQTQLTDPVFVSDPFDPSGRGRMYLTGDVVRRRPDGVVEFKGRNDRQIKIDGKRLELDEVENLLRQDRRVGDAAVISVEASNGKKRLAAYVTPAQDCHTRDFGELRADILRAFRDRAELHMVPAALTVMAAFPLTSSGKINRRSLPLPAELQRPAQTEQSSNATIASGDFEAVVADVWANVLDRAQVDRQTRFFDLGGTSMDAMRVHAELCKRLDQSIPISVLFDCATIAQFGAYLRGDSVTSTTRSQSQSRGARQASAMQRLRERRLEQRSSQ